MSEFWKQSSNIEIELKKMNQGKQLSETEMLFLREMEKMTKIMEDMSKKMIELEQRLSKTESRDRNKIRKNILDYLKNKNSSLLFSEWVITVDKNEFEYLNDHNYKDTIIKTLKRNLNTASEVPFCAFTEIKNDVFIYTKRSDIDGWFKMEQSDFKKILDTIHNKFDEYFIQWSEEENMDNQKMQDLQCYYSTKIDSLKLPTESVLATIKKCLYNALNKPMKQIEYE